MYILMQDYKNHSEYNFLLLISLLLVALGFYTVVYDSKHIMISPVPPNTSVLKEKVLSIVIATEKVVKKKIQKPISKKPIVKKPIVKKVVEQRVVAQNSIVEKAVEQRVVEPEVAQEILPVKTEPIEMLESKPAVAAFNASMKESFISGLYEAFNKNKFYPKMAKRRKLEGVVTVSFTLCKDGTIKNIFLNNSCGHKILDKAALKVVKSVDIYKAIPDAVSLTALNLNIPIKYSRG